MAGQLKPTKAELRQQEKRRELSQQGKQFRQRTTVMTMQLLTSWVGEERAKEAAGRISAALATSAASARDPSAIYKCTPDSIARCVAVAALTGIMPSNGAGALAYLVPRAPRKNETPQLNYQLSHRGLNALAARAGRVMIAIPVSRHDEITVDETGEVNLSKRDIDNPPESEDDLRGVVILVKSLETGSVIARGYMPQRDIHKRRAMSQAWRSGSGPWIDWYVEMCMKTAMHYAIGRGWCTLDDTEAARALQADVDGDLAPGDPMAAIENEEDPGSLTLEAKIQKQAQSSGAADAMSTPAGDPKAEPEDPKAEPEDWEVILNDAEAVIRHSPSSDEVERAWATVGELDGVPIGDFQRIKKLYHARQEAK